MSLLSQEEIDRLDHQIMPFGKFQGRFMMYVPASYWQFIRDGNIDDLSAYPEVIEYLQKMGKFIDAELGK